MTTVTSKVDAPTAVLTPGDHVPRPVLGAEPDNGRVLAGVLSKEFSRLPSRIESVRPYSRASADLLAEEIATLVGVCRRWESASTELIWSLGLTGDPGTAAALRELLSRRDELAFALFDVVTLLPLWRQAAPPETTALLVEVVTAVSVALRDQADDEPRVLLGLLSDHGLVQAWNTAATAALAASQLPRPTPARHGLRGVLLSASARLRR